MKTPEKNNVLDDRKLTDKQIANVTGGHQTNDPFWKVSQLKQGDVCNTKTIDGLAKGDGIVNPCGNHEFYYGIGNDEI